MAKSSLGEVMEPTPGFEPGTYSLPRKRSIVRTMSEIRFRIYRPSLCAQHHFPTVREGIANWNRNGDQTVAKNVHPVEPFSDPGGRACRFAADPVAVLVPDRLSALAARDRGPDRHRLRSNGTGSERKGPPARFASRWALD
jgi:hypothetical protein